MGKRKRNNGPKLSRQKKARKRLAEAVKKCWDRLAILSQGIRADNGAAVFEWLTEKENEEFWTLTVKMAKIIEEYRVLDDKIKEFESKVA